MNLVDLPNPNLSDIPLMLERLAAKVKAGEFGPVNHVIMVTEDSDGELKVFGYGKVVDTAREVGILQMAIFQISHK